MLPSPCREVTSERDGGDRPGSRGISLPGYSCGTAPDLHRLRLYALASGPQGTPVAGSLTVDESIEPPAPGKRGGRREIFPPCNLAARCYHH